MDDLERRIHAGQTPEARAENLVTRDDLLEAAPEAGEIRVSFDRNRALRPVGFRPGERLERPESALLGRDSEPFHRFRAHACFAAPGASPRARRQDSAMPTTTRRGPE